MGHFSKFLPVCPGISILPFMSVELMDEGDMHFISFCKFFGHVFSKIMNYIPDGVCPFFLENTVRKMSHFGYRL